MEEAEEKCLYNLEDKNKREREREQEEQTKMDSNNIYFILLMFLFNNNCTLSTKIIISILFALENGEIST